MRTVVHLLRHGKVHNPDGVLYGRLPGFSLSEPGHRMAERVAEHLAGADITVLVSSSLLRAQQTAAPLAAATGLTVTTDDRVIEATNVFEGRRVTGSGGALRQPANWPRLLGFTRPAWGEPYLEIAKRMEAALYETERAARGHEAVIVSHQLPIWTLRRRVEGRRLWHNPANRECRVASLTSLTFTDGVITGLDYREPAADLVDADAANGTAAGA